MYDAYYRKVWETKHLPIAGKSIERAAQDVRRRESATEREERYKKDTGIRRELQSIIKELARAGRSVSQIVKELSTNPEYEKFSKYSEYFVGYAENSVNKFGRPNNKNREDFDER